MRKIINSATTQYEPVLTEELVLDDRPISGSFNSITSDAVYKAISVDPGNVPAVESTDNGKVLTASYGEGGGSFAWATPSGGGGASNVEIISLPQSSASDADILAAYNAAVTAHTANKVIIGKITVSQGNYKYIACTKVSYDSNYTFEFSGTVDEFPGSTPSVPLYVWAQLACAPSESYYRMQYKYAYLGVRLQNWNPWYTPVD